MSVVREQGVNGGSPSAPALPCSIETKHCKNGINNSNDGCGSVEEGVVHDKKSTTPKLTVSPEDASSSDCTASNHKEIENEDANSSTDTVPTKEPQLQNVDSENGQVLPSPSIPIFPSKKRLYVSNLKWQITEDRLRQEFDPFGNVTEARIVLDRRSGWSRGFGFVSFDSEESACLALEQMNGVDIEGRLLRLEFARSTGPQPKRPEVSPLYYDISGPLMNRRQHNYHYLSSRQLESMQQQQQQQMPDLQHGSYVHPYPPGIAFVPTRPHHGQPPPSAGPFLASLGPEHGVPIHLVSAPCYSPASLSEWQMDGNMIYHMARLCIDPNNMISQQQLGPMPAGYTNAPAAGANGGEVWTNCIGGNFSEDSGYNEFVYAPAPLFESVQTSEAEDSLYQYQSEPPPTTQPYQSHEQQTELSEEQSEIEETEGCQQREGGVSEERNE